MKTLKPQENSQIVYILFNKANRHIKIRYERFTKDIKLAKTQIAEKEIETLFNKNSYTIYENSFFLYAINNKCGKIVATGRIFIDRSFTIQTTMKVCTNRYYVYNFGADPIYETRSFSLFEAKTCNHITKIFKDYRYMRNRYDIVIGMLKTFDIFTEATVNDLIRKSYFGDMHALKTFLAMDYSEKCLFCELGENIDYRLTDYLYFHKELVEWNQEKIKNKNFFN